jgi:phosphopantothenoylcysteine decarboxylase/phosphopantothenate--cysteine ligase
VVPVLTGGATRFVGELTFSALASEPAQTALFGAADPIPHTRLGQRADLVLVAPATARLLADYRTGRSGDLLTATLIATRAPVMVCPAMHTEMWEHPAVQDNLAELRRRGVHVVEPESGRLAGGDVGAGRLASPESIVAAVHRLFAGLDRDEIADPDDLAGLAVLVTAGGTREAIDPVRFIGNRSSGKQGTAIAVAAAARGAKVTLVTTMPAAVPAAVEVVRVESAAEMEAAVAHASPDADIVVMAAAVADFRPVQVAADKIKKGEGVPSIVLERTPDILAGLGARKPPTQVLVGFAAETTDLRRHAAEKLARKGADLLVANDVSQPGVGFEHDTNAVLILGADGSERDVPLADKRAVAGAVLDAALSVRSQKLTTATREKGTNT